jgi:putative intracellular protease/amidase
MNDLGEVSFAARLNEVDRATGDTIEAILRGDGKQLTTISSTAEQFNFFGFDTSVNNGGVVAFKAELDPQFNFDEGLFSGSGDKKLGTTTHYLASTSPFVGDDSRPSINNVGNIAFEEQTDGDFDDGVFVTTEGGGFTTIAHDPDHSVQEPVLNDAGTAAFTTSFFKAGQFVTAIVTGSGRRLRTIVDTQRDFASFGFRPAPLNNNGDVAFLATLADFQTTGIFVGADPVADRVIATGDTLDGATVTGLGFAEEGLNDSGQLAFTAFFQDPNTFETRVAVFRATPVP